MGNFSEVSEEQRVERVLEESLERVQTPEAAHAVVVRVERLAAGKTEATVPAASSPEVAAARIEEAAVAPGAAESVAQTLTETAAEAVAPTPAAEPMMTAAQAALTPQTPVSPGAKRGRRLLRDAVLRRMGP